MIVVLANESIKPSKLLRHLATKRQEFKDKAIDFSFKKKLQEENKIFIFYEREIYSMSKRE